MAHIYLVYEILAIIITIHWTYFAIFAQSDLQNGTTFITETVQTTSDTETENTSLSELNNKSEKGDNLDECLAFPLSPGEYQLFENGTAYVEDYKKYYSNSSYLLEDGVLIVCVPEIPEENEDDSVKFSSSFTYITRIGLGISMFCLILHLIAFFFISNMRNLPGYNLASLSLSLLLGYTFFMVGQIKGIEKTVVPCILVASGIQFFMLSSFLWMSTMAFDVFRSLLKATGKLRLVSRQFSYRKYGLYCLYSFGTPLVFVAVTLILDNSETVPDIFKPSVGDGVCWIRQRIPLIILFAAPVIAVVLSNLVFFGISAYIIFAHRMKMEDEVYKDLLKKNFLLYSRLATINGLTWVAAILANLVNTIALWYVFILLNVLQGLFIFLAFTCTQKVKKHIKTKLSSRRRKMSSPSSSPTFQSYWNTGLTLESDKVFTSDENAIKTEKV